MPNNPLDDLSLLGDDAEKTPPSIVQRLSKQLAEGERLLWHQPQQVYWNAGLPTAWPFILREELLQGLFYGFLTALITIVPRVIADYQDPSFWNDFGALLVIWLLIWLMIWGIIMVSRGLNFFKVLRNRCDYGLSTAALYQRNQEETVRYDLRYIRHPEAELYPTIQGADQDQGKLWFEYGLPNEEDKTMIVLKGIEEQQAILLKD